jgi:hypothetical protein
MDYRQGNIARTESTKVETLFKLGAVDRPAENSTRMSPVPEGQAFL